MARQTFFFPPCGSKYLQETEKKSSLNVLCVRSIPRDELTTNHFLKGVCTLEKKVNPNSESLKIQPYIAQDHFALGECYKMEGSGSGVWGGRVLPGLNGLRESFYTNWIL